ncbi:MAG: AzlC family ABC transporter permease, partial [Clostridiales bacterium]|nr:AzlC family ABC transporter permease [Clostridiales bacterium]
MEKRLNYKNGIIDGLPICFAYLAVSFTFGMTVTQKGFDVIFATIISGTNLTSAGQFAGVNLFAAGCSIIELFFAVFIINSRYILM